MRQIFLDTAYLQALIDTGDNLHRLAITLTARLGKIHGVTSEMVLTEFLNALSGRGNYLRQSAINLSLDLRNDGDTIIIPQTSEQFEQAFAFYQRRLRQGIQFNGLRFYGDYETTEDQRNLDLRSPFSARRI